MADQLVIQDDREAAANLISLRAADSIHSWTRISHISMGDADDDIAVLALARHRTASQAELLDPMSRFVEAWDARRTQAEQIVTDRSDADLQKQAMSAIDDMRAAISRARGNP